METFFAILIMAFMISLSRMVTCVMSLQIPLPLMQIAIGALLMWLTFGLHVEFDPELSLALFILPLLLADSWETSAREFLEHGRETFGPALALVVVTMADIGFLIYWVVLGIPLIPAFALTAILSPTNAVTFSGIVGGGCISRKVTGTLRGEALINNAFDLVPLRFTVAMVIGTIISTVGGAAIEFMKVATGGTLAGFIVSQLYGYSPQFLSRWGGGEPVTQIILLSLLSLASCLIAEHIDISDILAAAAAGVAITRSDVICYAPLAICLRVNNTWAILEFVFNGMVFPLLDLQPLGILETSLMAAEIDPNVRIRMLFTDIILIYAVLMLARFGWLWTMKKFSNHFLKKKPMEFGSWTAREIPIASFTRAYGAITLAGVLSALLLLLGDNIFPACYGLVFLAVGVILFSLFVDVVMLPILLQHIEVTSHSQQLREERIA